MVMSKLLLSFPDRAALFTCQLRVRVTDLNYGGHLSNDAILRFVQEARVRFLTTLGGSEKEVEGAGIILADAQLVFKAESFYGDLLNIEIAVQDWGKCDCAFYYRITRENDKKYIALVRTRVVFFDYQNRKIKVVPKPLKERIEALLRRDNEKIY